MRARLVWGAALWAAISACGGVSFEPRPGDPTPADAGAIPMAIEGGRAPTITPLAELEMPALAIALDATNVYWTSGAYTPPADATPWPIAMHCPKSGCASPTILAYATGLGTLEGPSDRYAPRFIAVDRTRVFWSSSDDSATTVAACAIGGCSDAPSTLLSTAELWGLGVADGETVWADSVVSACRPDDCAATTDVIAGGAPATMKLDGDQVYWADANAIRGCPVSGCVEPTVVVGVPEVTAFAVDATNVYWRAEAGLMACAKHGCTTPRLLVADDECDGGFVDMVADGLHVFWITGNSVFECAVSGCGGEPTRIDTPYWDATDRPNRLAVDDESLYWTTGALFTGSSGGKWLHAGGKVMKRTPK